MKDNEKIFNIEDYKFISNLIEEKVPILRQNKDFEHKYLKLIDMIDDLEKNLNANQKQQFEEIIDLFYETEEYYFALSYSLGIKYGND